MAVEPGRELILTPSTSQALAQLDETLRADSGISIALMTARGEIVYPGSDSVGSTEAVALRQLCSKAAVGEEEASAPFGDDGTAYVVKIWDMRNLLGMLVAYPANGKPPSPVRVEKPGIFGILHAFAALTAETSAKDVALESLIEELARRYEDLSLVYKLAGNMEVGKRLGSSLDNIFKVALAHMELDILIVFHPLAKRRKIHCLSQEGDRLTREERGALFKLEAHARAAVLRSGEPWVVNDVHKDARFSNLTNLCSHVLCVPITVSDDGAGAITAIKRFGKERFFMGDVKLISALAKQVAIVIRNARLFSEVRSLFLNLVKSLISIVEAKHKYTRGHSERVNKISCFLGKQLRLGRHAREVLHWASLFHDVGKISVPDAILNKPGELTEEEFDAIKQHPVVGFNVLSHIEQLREALPGIRHHHEKLDGSGYPDELKGNEIPLAAKIIAVADVYDALTSSRSYRPAMSVSKTLETMREGDGKHFDPRVLALFIRKHDEIIQTLDSFSGAAVAA